MSALQNQHRLPRQILRAMTHKRFYLISDVKDITLGYQTST